MILGTAAYMSPEQAKGRPVDRRADVWAFGCVLFEMLTGQRAFTGEDVADVLSRVLQREPDFDALPPMVPARVGQVLRVCLRKDLKQRAHDMADVRLALEGAFETAVAQTATSVPVVARGRAREYLAWGLATVATLLAVGASVLYLRAPRQTDTIVRFTVRSARWRRPPCRAPGLLCRRTANGSSSSPRARTACLGSLSGDIDAAEAHPLAGTDRAGAPFWAPDGRSLGFVKDGGLYRVALDGSAPRLLCSVPGGFSGGTWSARGVIVFASRSGLLQVPDTGGTPTPVTTLDAGAKETSHTWPWFLPDGRRLLFLALADEQSRGTIWATAIDDPARTRHPGEQRRRRVRRRMVVVHHGYAP